MKRFVTVFLICSFAVLLLLIDQFRFQKSPVTRAPGDVTEAQPAAYVPLAAQAPAVLPPSLPVVTVDEDKTDSVDFVSGVIDTLLLLLLRDWALNEADREALIALCVLYQQKRAALETQLIEVDVVSPTSIIVSVPPYLSEGKKLRDEFYAAIDQAIGARHLNASARMSVFLDQYFKGFGVATQIITVSPSDLPGVYAVRIEAFADQGLDFSHRAFSSPFPPTTSNSYNVTLAQMKGGEISFLPDVIGRTLESPESKK